MYKRIFFIISIFGALLLLPQLANGQLAYKPNLSFGLHVSLFKVRPDGSKGSLILQDNTYYYPGAVNYTFNLDQIEYEKALIFQFDFKRRGDNLPVDAGGLDLKIKNEHTGSGKIYQYTYPYLRTYQVHIPPTQNARATLTLGFIYNNYRYSGEININWKTMGKGGLDSSKYLVYDSNVKEIPIGSYYVQIYSSEKKPDLSQYKVLDGYMNGRLYLYRETTDLFVRLGTYPNRDRALEVFNNIKNGRQFVPETIGREEGGSVTLFSKEVTRDIRLGSIEGDEMEKIDGAINTNYYQEIRDANNQIVAYHSIPSPLSNYSTNNRSNVRLYSQPSDSRARDLNVFSNRGIDPSGRTAQSSLAPFRSLNGYTIQVAALKNDPKADQYKQLGEWQIYIKKTDPFFKILVGEFSDKNSATSALVKIQSLGFTKAFIVQETGYGSFWTFSNPSSYYQARALPQPYVYPSQRQHVVQRGETLYDIARKYGLSVAQLRNLNHIAVRDVILIGQVLKLE